MDDLLLIENSSIQQKLDELERQASILINPPRKDYVYRLRCDKFAVYDEKEFRRRFRLSKASVNFLHELIGEKLKPLNDRKINLTPMDKILISLRYYATGTFEHVVADFIGTSEATVCNIIPSVSKQIASLRQSFIKMPETNLDIDSAIKNFFGIAGMPFVIGAMDGTLVRIQEVGGAQNKEDFHNRKQFYSMNVQAICNAHGLFIDLVARWPGRTHDQTIFANSSIFERFLFGEFRRHNEESVLIADGGYAAEKFVITPLRANQNENRTVAENIYQRTHIKTRNIIERVFGQWKKRFPCLWTGMRFRKLETTMNVIIATAVLHNICKLKNDEAPVETIEENIEYQRAIALQNEIARGANRHQAHNEKIKNDSIRSYFERKARAIL